jgi:hypothetical protein
MSAVLTLAVAAAPSSPAYAAYPSTVFNVVGSHAKATGSITWYNRSVAIKGDVRDYYSSVGGYSQVRFNFFLDYDTEYATTTRTASYGEERDYNFTQEGPRGGIRIVYIRVCSSAIGGCADGSYVKPSS